MTVIFEQRKPGSWQSHLLDCSELCPEQGEADGDATWPFPSLSDGVSVAIRRLEQVQGECWVLINSPQSHVRHNGMAALLGLAVLADRDEIIVFDAISPLGRRFYFSTQRLTRVEPAPVELSLACPRCKLEIVAQSPAVRCPRCHVWHHQLSDRQCWTYADRCAACQEQDTSLNGELNWTPEEL